MRIRCINRRFRDLKAKGKPIREVGEEWEWADPSRVAEINSAGYGVMAEAVEDAPQGAPEPGAEQPAGDAPQTVAELRAMKVASLVALCAAYKVETPDKPKKDDLVAALAERLGLE